MKRELCFHPIEEREKIWHTEPTKDKEVLCTPCFFCVTIHLQQLPAAGSAVYDGEEKIGRNGYA